MPPAKPSAASSSMPPHKKRRFTRDQLLKNLQILGALPKPLPPTLPSPPASRSTSPAPAAGSKRKHSADKDKDQPKRPRTSSTVADRQRQNPHSHRPTNVRTDSARTASSATTPAGLTSAPHAPMRRPRRGKEWMAMACNSTVLYTQGRQLKYSSEARLWSTYPPNRAQYKPLANPPAPDHPYHLHASTIARLEGLEAIIAFSYAQWIKDYKRGGCDRKAWLEVIGLLTWWTDRWSLSDGAPIREKALFGVILMLEGFIHGRMICVANKYTIIPEFKKLDKLQHPRQEQAAQGFGSNSANSTPTNRAGLPINTNQSAAAAIAAARIQAAPPATNPSVDLTVPVPSSLVACAVDQGTRGERAQEAFRKAQETVTLPNLNLYFPKTFARMVHSTLSATDEHEPDIDDDEGELFWPGQAQSGDGIGWVCLMGKAILRELGKEFGYQGIEAAIPKP